tara:strand:+ start:497 stop:880 length:384 start_codon:yes stop_codon:yes gene_type:complete
MQLCTEIDGRKGITKMKRIACPALLLACLPLAALAQEEGALDETPVTTPDEPVVISDYQPASQGPEIVIRPGEQEVFYEYWVNGQLMEIKVVPEVGPEYYLVPADGGGWIRETESDMLVPSWVIFRW